MAESPLFTIGYEGATPEALIAALQRAGVTTLVDVRELPNSRRPGFAKRALSEALGRAGIGYRHLRALGTPPEGRAAARAGRSAEMKRIVGARLAGTEARAAVADLSAAAREQRLCLLCLERDPERCHRSLVAEAIASSGGVAIVHLDPAGDPAGDVTGGDDGTQPDPA
ncbi:DUF488 domain-containing protein [Roseicella aquatilis]|uniref:DUF488 domain-containing protein n=1 Tax=Roseicella aquatilis TaxID=2527868 RepID=A0A4R4DEG7_9PROT|nr:DUF488 domain-containing protein [Roseicella aquatilis]TCZ58765.1 DUF488 domain-containing protein [Roseicella aquatilis]